MARDTLMASQEKDSIRPSRRVWRPFLILLSILLVLVAVAVLVIRSHTFHRYLLAVIIERASQATGGRVEVGDFAFHWSGLRADLYRIELHGREPDSSAPIFSADHIGAGLKVISLRHEDVSLNDLVIDHPVVHLLIDAQGRTNLPASPPRPAGIKPLNIFELAIGHFALNNGAIYYNDKYTPLIADVEDLDSRVSFNPIAVGYDGSLRYRQGRIQFGGYNPFVHDLQANFTAAPSGLTLNSLQLSSGLSSLKAQLHLENYANPSVAGSYQADVRTRELAHLLKEEAMPLGEINTQGTVNYKDQPGQPLLDNLAVTGRFSSPALALSVPQARTAFRAVAGEYQLEGGTLEVRSLQADVLGGHIAGRFSMADLARVPHARLQATIGDLSLAAARDALLTRPLPPGVGITGQLNGSVQASWYGSLRDLEAQCDSTIAGSLAGEPAAGVMSNSIPVESAVHVAYDGRRQEATLHNTYVQTPHSRLGLDGSFGGRANLGIQAKSDDLREVGLLALILENGSPERSRSARSRTPQLKGLAGSASFNGSVTGRLADPQLTGLFTAANLTYSGASVRSLRAGVSLSPSGLALHQGQLQTGSKGHADFDVAVGLRHWSYTPQNPIDLRLAANRLAVADLQRMAGLQYPVSGTLSANVAVHGSEASPVGQGSIQLTQARAWQQPIQSLIVKFQGTGSDIRSTLNLVTPAGSASATLAYNWKSQDYDAQVNLPSVQLQRIEPLKARNLQISGVLKASATGHGSLKAPQLEAAIEVPKLQVGDQKLDGLKAQAGMAQQRATFSIDSNVVGAALHANGAVELTGDYQATANVDSQNIQLGPVLTSLLSEAPSGLEGHTEIHAALKGPLKDPQKVEANVEIPTLSLDYQSLQIANTSPIHLDYRAGLLTLQRVGLKGTGTDLALEAKVPVRTSGSLQVTATGNVDLQLLKILHPDWDSSGQITLNVGARGSIGHPKVRGVVRVADGRVLLPNAPLGVEKLNGEIDVDQGRARIKSLSAQVGGGAVSATGSVSYQPGVQFELGLTGKDVRLRYPQGTRTLLASNLSLSGTPDAALLSGQVVIDRLSLTPSFDLSTFADQFSGPSSAASEGMMQNVKLNISVTSRQELALASSRLNFQGTANLRVQGTLAEPVIVGRTDITSGEMFYLGNRYQVQNGVIDFVNPVQTEPVLNLTVTTTIQQFNLTVNLVGPLDRLRTTYTSDPPLAPVDIINLLRTGQTTEASQTSAVSPESVIAQGIAGQVSSKVQKLAGISSLTIDPQIGGNQGNAGAQLAIQQRVTKNLFFTFATDVTTTQGAVVQVEYQISRRYALSAVRDQTGGYQLQVKVHKTF